VGIYSVAATLVAFVPVALQSVNQIFSPTIADLHAAGARPARPDIPDVDKMDFGIDGASGVGHDRFLEAPDAVVWLGV